MPSVPLDIVGKSGWIAGWGKITQEHGHTGTNILRTASVPIIGKLSFLDVCISYSINCDCFQPKRNASIGTRKKTFTLSSSTKWFVQVIKIKRLMHALVTGSYTTYSAVDRWWTVCKFSAGVRCRFWIMEDIIYLELQALDLTVPDHCSLEFITMYKRHISGFKILFTTTHDISLNKLLSNK